MSPNLLIINIGSANIDLNNDTNYILIQKIYQVNILLPKYLIVSILV